MLITTSLFYFPRLRDICSHLFFLPHLAELLLVEAPDERRLADPGIAHHHHGAGPGGAGRRRGPRGHHHPSSWLGENERERERTGCPLFLWRFIPRRGGSSSLVLLGSFLTRRRQEILTASGPIVPSSSPNFNPFSLSFLFPTSALDRVAENSSLVV